MSKIGPTIFERGLDKAYHFVWARIWDTIYVRFPTEWIARRVGGHLGAYIQDDYTDEGFDVNRIARYPMCGRLNRRSKRNIAWLEKEGYDYE